MGKRLFFLFFGFTLITAVAAMLVIGSAKDSLQQSVFNKQRFDQKIWQSYHQTQDRDSPRGLMANDLRQKLLAERPTREQVIELLGPADLADEPDRLSYHLGMWSHNRGRIDTFDIFFGADGRLARIVFSAH